MDYTTLEEIVKSIEEKYDLDKHFEGFVMLALKNPLNVKVSKDLDIEYLVNIYKSQDNLPIETLYLEVSYENKFSLGSFLNYCQPKIAKYLVFDGNRYFVSRQNLDSVYDEIKKIASEFKNEELLEPDEVREILKDEYGVDNKVLSLYNISGRIIKEDLNGIAINLLNDLSQNFVTILSFLKYRDIKKTISQTKKNIRYSKTFYNILTEKCEKDMKCMNYILSKFNGDFLIPENLVNTYENAIGKLVSEYKRLINSTPKKELDLSYIG